MIIHIFESYFGVYHCKKCGNKIISTLYFLGNDDTYCKKCFPIIERKLKLKKIGELK